MKHWTDNFNIGIFFYPGTFCETAVVNCVIHGLFCDAVDPVDATIKATIAIHLENSRSKIVIS